MQSLDKELDEKVAKLEEAYFTLRFTAFYNTELASPTVEGSMKIFSEKYAQHFSTFLTTDASTSPEAFENTVQPIFQQIRSEIEKQTYDQLDKVCEVIQEAQKLLSDFEGIQRTVEEDHPPSLDMVTSRLESIASLRAKRDNFPS